MVNDPKKPVPTELLAHSQMELPVLSYATPHESVSDGKRVGFWMLILLGGLVAILGILLVSVGFALIILASEKGNRSDLSIGIICLVVGLVLLIGGWWLAARYNDRLEQAKRQHAR